MRIKYKRGFNIQVIGGCSSKVEQKTFNFQAESSSLSNPTIMKKSRKIKINGEEYKYFVDTGAVDEDGEIYTKVWLYYTDEIKGQIKGWWNFAPKKITNAMVKEAVLAGEFYCTTGRYIPQRGTLWTKKNQSPVDVVKTIA